MAMAEEILLAKMAQFSANFASDGEMIVNDQADVGSLCYGNNRQRHLMNCFKGQVFCAQLDQVSAAIAKLLGDEFGRAAIQIGGVHEGVKPAISERFHRVWENIVCQSQFERRASAAIGPLEWRAN